MMKSILLLLLIGAIQVSTGSIIKSNFRDVLLSMGINPNKPLGVAFPKLVSLQNKDDIHLCCEPRVGYKGVNLFNSSFLEVVEEYFNVNSHAINKENFADKIKALVENLEAIINFVEDCVHGPSDKKMKLGLTSMSHYSRQEYLQITAPLPLIQHNQTNYNFQTECDMNAPVSLPSTLDFRNNGAVSPVKQQMQCGSCYIFASVAALESQYLLHGIPKTFSEQAILNCIHPGRACMGGWPSEVFDYISNKGVTDDINAPYMGVEQKCRQYTPTGKISSYCYYDQRYSNPLTDRQLQTLLYKYGPVVVGFHAGPTFQHFLGEKLAYPNEGEVNHVVLLIGYTPTDWIFKNSWGTEWGQGGFSTVTRNDNRCAFNKLAGIPFI